MVALRWLLKLKIYPLTNIYTSSYRTISSDCLSKEPSPSKLNPVVNILQTFGFSQAQASNILVKQPTGSLKPDTVKSKLEFLLSICNQSETDVVKIVSTSPKVLKRSLNNHLVPVFDMLKLVTGSHDNAAAAIVGNPFVLTYSVSIPLMQNVKLLKNLGVPNKSILKFVTGFGQIAGKQHDKFCQVVGKVRDMGFDPSSYAFRRAVQTLCLVTDETWEAKCDIYRSFGFSDDEIVLMFRRMPAAIGYSEKRIRQVMEFYVNKLGWTPSRLVDMPYVTAFSLEKRVIPRCSVLQALALRKSTSNSWRFYHILAASDIAFFEKYVTAHMDEVPEVMDAYTGKLRFDEYTFICKGTEY